MGPNNLCYVTRHFLSFPYVPMSLFKTLMSLSTVFIKGHVRRISTTFTVAMSHFIFYPRGTLIIRFNDFYTLSKQAVNKNPKYNLRIKI